MSDNVVKFPPKDKAAQEREELQQARKELEELNMRRVASIKSLKDKVAKLHDQESLTAEHMSPASVEALRGTRAALKNVEDALEAHDKLVDMMVHDMVGLVQNMEMHAMSAFQTSTHLQTLLEVLKDKGLISEDEMRAKWEVLVKQSLKNQAAE